MTLDRSRAWRNAGRAIGVLLCIVAVVLVVETIMWALEDQDGSGLVIWVLGLPMALFSATVCVAIAIALWRRWDAWTVRAGTAALLGVVLLGVRVLLGRVLPPVAAIEFERVMGPMLLILAAVGYRVMTTRVIQSAGMEDPKDAAGEPLGRANRARMFAALLAMSVLDAGDTVGSAMLGGWLGSNSIIVGLLIPVGCWIVAYRLVVWWTIPPEAKSLPPGKGFEMVMKAEDHKDEAR